MDKQPEALRLADELERWLHVQAKDRIGAAAELRRLYAENQDQAERIQDIYKQLDDTEKEVDDLRAEMHEEAKINGAGAERELKLMTDLENKQAELLRIKAHAEMRRMDDEALLQQALEALEMIDRDDNDRDFLMSAQCYQLDSAITALNERLQ